MTSNSENINLDSPPLENPLEKVTAYFLEEAQEHLDILETGLANLATTILDYQQLADFYRSTFALRGGLGMLGYSSPIAASSGLDACLQQLSEYPIPVDVGIITAFLELVHLLRQSVQLAAKKSAIASEEFATLQFQSRLAIDSLKAQLSQLSNPTVNPLIHQPEAYFHPYDGCMGFRPARVQIVIINPQTFLSHELSTAFVHLPDVEIHCARFEQLEKFDGLSVMGDSRGNLSNSGINQAVKAYFGEGIRDRIQTAIAAEYLGEMAIGTALVVMTGHPQHPFLVYAPAIADFGAIPLSNAPYLATRGVLLAARHHNRQNYARPNWQIRTLVLTLMGLSGMGWRIDTIVEQMLQAVISCQEDNS